MSETESIETRRPDRRRSAVATVSVVALLGALSAAVVGLAQPSPPAKVTAVKAQAFAAVAPAAPPAATVGMIADLYDPSTVPFPTVTHSDWSVGGCRFAGCERASWTISSPVGWVVTASRGDAVTDTATRDFTLALAVPAGVVCPAVTEAIVDGSGRDRWHATTGTWTRAAGSTVIMCHAGSATWRQSTSQVLTVHAVGVRVGEVAKMTVTSTPAKPGVLVATASVDGRQVGSVTSRVTQPPTVCTARPTDVSDAAFLACGQLARGDRPQGTVVPLAPVRYVATVSGPLGRYAVNTLAAPAGTVPTTPSAAPHGQKALSTYLAAWLRTARPVTSGTYTVTVDRWDVLVAKAATGRVYASSASQIRAAQEVATQSYTASVASVVSMSTGSGWLAWAVGTGLAILALLCLLWLATHRRRRTPDGDDGITG